MATNKIIDPKDKKNKKPDMDKNMDLAKLKDAVKWLYEYLDLD